MVMDVVVMDVVVVIDVMDGDQLDLAILVRTIAAGTGLWALPKPPRSKGLSPPPRSRPCE